jgi:hypothetical protein
MTVPTTAPPPQPAEASAPSHPPPGVLGTPDPAAPSFGRRYSLARAVSSARARSGRAAPRIATPLLLRIMMALACVPIALFALAVHLGVTRNDRAVETVGQDATQGITLAQQIKLNLAELDDVAVHDLLTPPTLGPSGFPDDYSAKRRELHGNLVLAASEVPATLAYQQRLENIDYALGHYHALLRDSFDASDDGNPTQAATLYAQAHGVMQGTLLSEADSFDKANTYVLNNTYDRHKSDASSTVGLILVSWAVLLALLIGVQLLVAKRFRRVVNLALAAATVVAAVSGIFAITRLNDSSSNLTTAREGAFDGVHVLARARATVVSAWQAEGQLLLDPSGQSNPPDAADGSGAGADEGFRAEADKLFRLPDGAQAASTAQAGEVPEGSGGYLATVIDAEVSEGGDRAATEALVAFGAFLVVDADLRELMASGDVTGARAVYEDGEAFDELTSAIDLAQSIDQRTFDDHAQAAQDATRNLGWVNAFAAVVIAALVILGLYQRLREYRS